MKRLLFLICLLLSPGLYAVVEHRVDLAATRGHLVPVETRFAVRQPEVEVWMAVWTPGSYLVREFSRNVQDLVALDSTGRALAVEKTAKNRWRIEAGDAREVRLRYRVYAREMSVRTSFVDDEFALINAPSLFLQPPQGRQQAQRVDLVLPEGWRAFSSMERQEHGFRAKDFDQLVDSPIVAGLAQVSSFEVGRVGHHLVHLGDSSLWDLQRAAQDVAALVSRQYLFWGEFPYDDPYFFFNLITEAGGGLEHLRSTVMMTNRWVMRKREDYVKWLGLVSHEFFHVWNVKAMRPESLDRYDYESENYLRELWLAEGFTSYYGPVLLSRAGLINPQEYFKQLAKRIRDLERKPGRFVRSLEDASFDAWIKHYRPDENSANSTVSYYNKGAVVAFLLDARIRSGSNGEKSLDDLMRTLYRRFGNDHGFRDDDVRRIASNLAGADLGPWFDRHVAGTDPLDYQPALHWFGLEMITEDEPKDGPFADPPKIEVGAKVEEKDHRLRVIEVHTDGPAHRAGLQAEDEILALDGIRVAPGDWSKRLGQLRAGEEVDVLLSRRGRILTRSLTVEQATAAEWKIKDSGKQLELYRARLSDWLGKGWYADPNE